MSTKQTTVKKKARHNRTPVKDRKKYPYVVFQIEKGLRTRLRRKTKAKNTSMSQFVEDLIKKAV